MKIPSHLFLPVCECEEMMSNSPLFSMRPGVRCGALQAAGIWLSTGSASNSKATLENPRREPV